MLIELLFKLLIGTVSFIIDLIPEIDFTVSRDWISGLNAIFQYVNVFVDTTVILFIISVVLIRDNFVFLKNIFMAIINRIPFIN